MNFGNSYFKIGNESKAREIEFGLIEKYPNEDEPYQVMCNWYMYYSKNIDKLEEVVTLAISNNHELFGGFAITRLIEHYTSIHNKEKQEYYKKKFDELSN